MKTTLTQNVGKSLLIALAIMFILCIALIFTSCSEKTDPYPPLREIYVEIHSDCTYELTNDQGFLKTGPINGMDSILVATEHIEKGQHWTLVLHKNIPQDSTIILVNRRGAFVTSDRQGDTLKTYNFTIEL